MHYARKFQTLKSNSVKLSNLFSRGLTSMMICVTNTCKRVSMRLLPLSANRVLTHPRTVPESNCLKFGIAKHNKMLPATLLSLGLLTISACGTTNSSPSSLPSPEKVEPTPPSVPFDYLIVPSPCFVLSESDRTFGDVSRDADELSVCAAELWARLYRLSVCSRNISTGKECLDGE